MFGCFLLVLAVPLCVNGEYRVALLIANTDYEQEEKRTVDLKSVDAALQSLGFRTTTITNVQGDKELKNAIEAFASRTPTRSTALVYFFGEVDDKNNLRATRSRGTVSIADVLKLLNERGGANRQLVFVDAQVSGEFQVELPPSSQVTLGETSAAFEPLKRGGDLIQSLGHAGETFSSLGKNARVAGAGSVAVSPPTKFATGSKAGDEWVNEMGVVFCWCPPGEYIAGSPEDLPGRYPDETQRKVGIEKGFWLSKYELAHSQIVAGRKPGRGSLASYKLHPSTMINHDDAKAMTRNYTKSEQAAKRLPADWEYSLPTEDQWEYAARAGTTTPYYFGGDVNELPLHANFGDKSYYDSLDIFSNAAHRSLNDGAATVAPVGSYQPNPWGFHDMYGNVAEWCINYAIRGGGWVSDARNCRSAYRDSYSSRNEQPFIGYRLVIQPR